MNVTRTEGSEWVWAHGVPYAQHNQISHTIPMTQSADWFPSWKHHHLPYAQHNQIAIDAARGLQYIHEHTKTHYVHPDMKTSYILLDASFRAKVINNLYTRFHILLKCFTFVDFVCLWSLSASPDFRFWVSETCWESKWGRNFNYQSCWYIWISCSGVSIVQ